MNILLISANTYSVPYKVFPLGVSYIKTYIQDHYPDWSVAIYDFNFGSYADFEIYLNKNRFDFIGLSLRNSDDVNFYAKESFINHYIEICNIIRKNSDVPLIAGGSCVSIFPEEMYEKLKVDYIITGEGEKTLCELIIKLQNNENINDIEGLMYQDEPGVFQFKSRSSFSSSLNVRFDREYASFYLNEGGMLNIQTKRGCPFKCIYCTYPIIDGKKVRTLDPKLIVENMKELYQIEKNNYLFFTDSVFNIHEDYNEELANRIIESGIKMKWGAYFAPRNFKKERLELYKKAGLTHIEFGTDSFSDLQLKNYKKDFQFSDVLNATRIAQEVGVFHSHFLILGGIGETEETFQETIVNSEKLEGTIIFPFIGMRIYPNTKLHEVAIQEGKIGKGSILEPTYYISDQINVDLLKEKVQHCKNIWVFPDEEKNPVVDRLREKHRRGPLWEYLKYSSL
jgi:radical SAM superfamily enzyme YgiQ (UPF0313 family)